MLSKIIGISTVLMLFMIPSMADAHQRHKPKPKPVKSAVTISVTLGWDWVDATLFRRGHWNHPHYGRDYNAFHAGPPPARPHAHATWVPGHYEGRGHHRHWVSGHWRQ